MSEISCSNTTNETATLIRKIGKDVVHKICSNQVISNLAIATKELLENALDAGSTQIDIKFTEYGLESIEVTDNGSGVEPHNFQGLTSKYSTSKLNKFSDLESIGTFGFRGEALSSLCSLSSVSIITRHQSSDIGTRLDMNSLGEITKQTPCARQTGTSVIISNLFASVPVRRREFEKNHKSDFSLMCQVLYAYCLISTGVRITCTNKTGNNVKRLISTNGSASVLDNVTALFGGKLSQTLVEIQQPFDESEEISEALFQELDLYVPQKVSFLTKAHFDKYSIQGWISSCEHGCGRKAKDRQFFYVNSRPCELKNIAKIINETYKYFNLHQYPFVILNIEMDKSNVDVNITPDKRQVLINDEQILCLLLKKSLLKTLKCNASRYKLVNSGLLSTNFKEENNSKINLSGFPQRLFESQKNKELQNLSDLSMESEVISCSLKSAKKAVKRSVEKDTSSSNTIQIDSFGIVDKKKILPNDINDQNFLDENLPNTKSNKKPEIAYKSFQNQSSINKRSTKVSISLEQISNNLQLNKSNKKEKQKKNLNHLKFKSMTNISKTADVEEELNRKLHGEDFLNMDIVGQFNLGFIITYLNGNLFIVDQHATDEKYNFEFLKNNTVLQSQQLVVPETLSLSAINEDILISNIKMFEFNGFKFSIDENELPTKRVKIIAKPFSNSWNFDKDDIHELLLLLEDNPSQICRPSRIASMLANRACRKSVMIGTPLSITDMRKIVNQIEKIEYPWNCPHGRPTMRHLLDISVFGGSLNV